LLRPHCALTALVDASHRYDPPRCAEATRREIIQKVEDWIRHDSLHSEPPSSIFWLYGGAGAGKSALAQTLAEKFKINEGLAASFFFFRTEVERNTGNSLIPTLALQLVQSFQGLTPIVEQIILRNADLFKKNRQTQMLELLVEPLIRLSLKETAGAPVHAHTTLKSHPRLVVIDGLDECSGSDIQCDLLRIIASAIPHMPYPLRFLITSRPESHITRAFQHNVGEVAQYNLSEDSDADSDIRRFLDEEFAQIRCTHPLRQHLPFQWPPPSDISPIVERSSAHFIYASTVIRFIQSPKHRPDDRLQVILGLKQPYERERPYALLDSLYTLIFLEIQDPSQLEKIHCAFGIIHLRSIKVGLAAGSQWTSDRHMIEVLLELRPGDLDLIFDPLLSLVAFDQDNIRVLHKSLLDYLLDPSRSRDFQLDLGLANESAANHILRENKSQDGWCECSCCNGDNLPTICGYLDLAEFHDFAYHCQFACLNDTLKRHLRPLACDPEMIFTESLSTLFGKSTRSSLLQSILYFLQAICRQVSKQMTINGLQSDLITSVTLGF